MTLPEPPLMPLTVEDALYRCPVEVSEWVEEEAEAYLMGVVAVREKAEQCAGWRGWAARLLSLECWAY